MKLYLVIREVTKDDWDTIMEQRALITAPNFESAALSQIERDNGLRHCQRLTSITEHGPIAQNIKTDVIDDNSCCFVNLKSFEEGTQP